MSTPLGPEKYVQELLKHNAKVYIACRSKERAEAAIADLKAKTEREALFLHLDLGDLISVKAAAEEFKRLVNPLRFCNYGSNIVCNFPVKRASCMCYSIMGMLMH